MKVRPSVKTMCERCRGEGSIITTPCEKCRGQGRVRNNRRVVVNIPAGVDDGINVRVTGEGEVGGGDEIRVIARDPNAVPVTEITRLYIAKRYGHDEVASVRRALQVAALPESWKGAPPSLPSDVVRELAERARTAVGLHDPFFYDA